ncbi:MAG TPA: peptide ABC transporter substrate-binding protein [Kofleriaceae bacterium]|nr:peptide ABC transporter substrate-binding protein [Kofleriaceae bacterium]
MRAAWLSAVVVAACGLPDGEFFGRVPEVTAPRHLRYCNSKEPEALDPAMATTTTALKITHVLFDGLTIYDAHGLPEPSLATRWDVSDDLRTYTFHLRDGARWSNGRPLTAWDVAYQVIRVVHPLTASPNGDNLATLRNARGYLGRRVFVLRRPVAPYPAGELVELAEPGEPREPARIDLRAASRPLALRDLGAAAAAAYAWVPAEREVALVMTTGGRATRPSPDGSPWAYVFDPTGDGVYGWVPAAELDREPHGDDAIAVRRVTADGERPVGAADDARPVVTVHGRDLQVTPDVLGIAVPDAHTIVFENAEPTPSCVGRSNNPALRPTPIEAVSRWPRRWTEPGRIVTSGPMTLTAWRERDAIVVERSPTYWNPGDVRLDRITFFAMDDQAAAVSFYFTGGCDAVAANTIPSTYLPALLGPDGTSRYADFRIEPYLGIYFVYLNTEKLANRHLRRALALAIDRAQIPRFTQGNEIPTAQLTPGTPIAALDAADLAACGVARTTPGVALIMKQGALCYVPPPGLDHDLAAARAELAAARMEMGAAFPAKLTYRYNAGTEVHKQIAEYLQAQWATLGLPVELEAQEWKTFVADTRAGRYELARFGSIGNLPDPETEFLPLFRCGAPDNRSRYCNPAFERLLDQARPVRDRVARNAILQRAEQVMIEDAPVIPLYVYTQKHLQKPYVRDLAINLVDQAPLWRAWLDPAWRSHR